MKKVAIMIICSMLLNLSYAQGPHIEIWDRRFGGMKEEELSAIIQSADGSYLLGGFSTSGISGNKTQNNWDTALITYDYWIVNVDSNGNKLWDRRFGGNSDDILYAIQSTIDSGYILGGYSGSGISGDKTQPSWGFWDYWIVKTDSLGNKKWDKRFGGNLDDLLISVYQTRDGGFILGGESQSGISGDKTQSNWDTTFTTKDYWIVKIDSVGNKQWDKRYGGTLMDYMNSLIQTKDGGYLLGGTTYSDSSGDVSQPTFGGTDYWIVRVDSLGNKLWDKRFGGDTEDDFSSLLQTSDGGYIIAGSSASDISGNKSQPNCNFNGSKDYWIIKIDSAGNKLWDKDYGGSNGDILYSIIQTQDDGLLLSGYSGSPISCDKSENSLGSAETWIIKTDSLGNKQWDKTMLTNGNDYYGFAFETGSGCYVIANDNYDNAGGYKTQANWDTTLQTSDYWVVKFCFTGTPEVVKDITTNHQLNIYPNPFTSELDITLAQANLKEADISICNILGQTIYAQHETNLSSTYTKMLDLSYLPNGVYFVEVVVDGEVITKEIVKQ